MERLTYDFCIEGNHCWQIKGADNLECREVCRQQEENGCKDCPIAKAFDRLAAIEDILGDEYDLERLRELVEVRHGRWIFDHMTGNWAYYAHCSECGLKKHFEDEEAEQKEKYCSFCGALMREIKNGEK